MSKIREITVSLDLTVQPKQYLSMKFGLTVTRSIDAEMTTAELATAIKELREDVANSLHDGMREEVTIIYGKVVGDYVVNQKGA